MDKAGITFGDLGDLPLQAQAIFEKLGVNPNHLDDNQKKRVTEVIKSFPDENACVDKENHFSENQSIEFRIENLHQMFTSFTNEEYDPEKAKKFMIKYERQFRKICQNLQLHMGSSTIETDIFKGIESVMKRDFEEDLNAEKIQIFVPKIFLSKFPEVIQYDRYIKNIEELKLIQDINEISAKIENELDAEKKERLAQRLEDSQKKMEKNEMYKELRSLEEEEVQMVKNLPIVRGERAEKKLFKAIKKHFSRADEEVAVFYAYNFMGSVSEKHIKPVEKDFILINLTKRYIMPIEVKTNFHKQSLSKAKKQIKGTMELLNDWVAGDLTEECGWRFVPAICFEGKIPKVNQEFCANCVKYVFHGDEMYKQLKATLKSIPFQECSRENYEKAKKEFVKVLTYLLFFSSFDLVATPSNLTKKVSGMLHKAGKAYIIEMHRCWTPNQLPLLKGNLPKVLFMSAPSTGKTTLMEAKAFQCMKNEEDVVFIIPFGFGNKIKTLLALKLEQHWQQISQQHQGQNKFHVCSIKTKWSSITRSLTIDYKHLHQLIQSDKYKNAAIFADELSIFKSTDLQALMEIASSTVGRHIWLAITGMRQNQITPEEIKSEFEKQDFYIPILENPLRNSSAIVDFAYPSIKSV